MNKLNISLLVIGCLCYLVVGQFENQSSDDMFEDDMKIARKNSRSFGIENKNRRWPNGVIYYTLSSEFSSNSKQLIRDAMDLVESKTSCIKFFERTEQVDYVSIEQLGGCWSYVGYFGGMQQLSLGSGCVHKGIIVHELMHTIGFMHEQNRPDRNDYVDIHFENIKNGVENNFKLYNSNYITFGPYDYYSIMHYNSKAFSKNGNETIVPKDSDVSLKHSAYKTDEEIMTTLDVHGVRTLYECDPITTTTEDSITTTTEDPITTTTEDPITTTTEAPYFEFKLKNDLSSNVLLFKPNGKKTVLIKNIKSGKKHTQIGYKNEEWVVFQTKNLKFKSFVIGKGKFKDNMVEIKISDI